jgi:hypothetical protein
MTLIIYLLSLGNAVTPSPDGSFVYATTANGSLYILDAETGMPSAFSPYLPPASALGLLPASTSGVAFGSFFVVYAVTDGLFTTTEECRVVAVSPTGEQLWVSNSVPGACSGDPQVSSDDAYVYINSNNNLGDGTISGQFNIFEFGESEVFFQSTPGVTPRPFGPLGMFRSPSTGSYLGGAGNTNDILVWSNSLGVGEESVCCGGTWVFQFPTGDGPLSIEQLLPNPDGNAAAPGWYSDAAPVLYNGGTSMVFSVSRSQFRTWINPDRFDLRATGRNTATYETARPPVTGTIASVALSSDPLAPQIYAPVAGPQLVSMNSDLTPLWAFSTTSAVLSQPKVAPDDSRVYFSEENGIIYSLFPDGTGVWFESVGAATQSDIGLSANGATLYYGTNLGDIVAWTVAGLPPTEAPTSLPTMVPLVESQQGSNTTH